MRYDNKMSVCDINASNNKSGILTCILEEISQ